MNNGKITSDLTEICSNVCVETNKTAIFLAKNFVWFLFSEMPQIARLLVVYVIVVFEFRFGLNRNAEPTKSIFKRSIFMNIKLEGRTNLV